MTIKRTPIDNIVVSWSSLSWALTLCEPLMDNFVVSLSLSSSVSLSALAVPIVVVLTSALSSMLSSTWSLLLGDGVSGVLVVAAPCCVLFPLPTVMLSTYVSFFAHHPVALVRMVSRENVPLDEAMIRDDHF